MNISPDKNPVLLEAAKRLMEGRKRERDKKEDAENLLRAFVEQAWHVIEPATPFIPGWNIDAVADHLQGVSEGHIRNLLVNVPPRTLKSGMISIFWPAWDWIKHPELRWLYTSYTSKLTLEHSMKCRRVIESPWYQANWGDRYQLIGEQNTKENYENDKTGHRIATSIHGVGTGKGGDRLIGDDPNNVEEVESEIIRQTTIDNWDHSMSTRGNNPKTVAKVVVQQRTHEQDLSGHLIEQGGYVHLMLPMRFEVDRKCVTFFGGKTWQDPRTKEGELLCEQRFGEAEVAEIEKRLGSYMAAGQLQQRPAPAGGGLLKTHWWRYWKPAKLTMDPVPVKMPDGTIKQVEAIELPDKFDTTVQAWDCLDSETEILTDNGWRGRGQVSVGDMVYSLDKDTEKLELVPVEEYGERPVSPEERFVRITSGRIDVRVTEGHNLFVGLVSKKLVGKTVTKATITARDLIAHTKAVKSRSYQLPISAEFDFPGVPLTDDELKLIAWFITDGGFGNSYIQITQTKHHKHAIRELISRLGMDFIEKVLPLKGRGRFANAKAATKFSIPKGVPIGRYKRKGWVKLTPWLNKEIAPELMLMTKAQFKVFWEELMKGDGDSSNGYLCSWRKIAAERLQQMAVTRGYSSSIHTRPSPTGTPITYVCAREKQWIESRPSVAAASRLTFDDPAEGEIVWCVQTKHSTMVTRRKGRVTILGNCTFKDEQTSDFVVGGVVAAKGANRFIIDMVRERMDLPKTVAAVRQMSTRHPSAQTKLIEDKANGPAVIQMLHGKIGGFIAVNPIGGKFSRAAAAGPMLESGNWYLPHPQLAPWVPHFINECASFPKGSYDDCVDFWSMSAARLLNNAPVEDEDDAVNMRIRGYKEAGWTA